jgi:hypothetical protein
MSDVDCIVCMSAVKSWRVSRCTVCKDNGIVCHGCLYGWANAGHSPWVCTVCKTPSGTMRNVPYALQPDVRHIVAAIPRALLVSQIQMMERLQGWIVTVYGILLLVFVALFTFMFVYVTLLITVGMVRQTVFAIEYAL